MTLTKADIVESIILKIGLARPDARQIVDDFFGEIRSCLATHEEVKLSSFGNFEVRKKSARPGRNPKTGEEVMISERHVVSFKAGQKLKARVAASKPKTRK